MSDDVRRWAGRRLAGAVRSSADAAKMAGSREHLVLMEKTVVRDGKEHQWHFWVKPEEVKKQEAGGAKKMAEKEVTKDPKDVPRDRTWVAKHEDLPDETWTKYFDKNPAEGGQVKDPERQKLHDKIKSEVLSKAASVPETQQPVAILMMGGPASGKSSMARGIDKSRFVSVDSDAIKAELPEYKSAVDEDGSRGASAKNAALMAHEESSYLAKKIRDGAIEGRKNLLFDGTGANAEGYSRMVDRLHKSGYRVTVLAADLPNTDEAVSRAAGRATKTGRWLDADKVIRPTYAKIPASFLKVAAKADRAQLFDTSGEPRLSWEHDGGRETVHDAKSWGSFKSRAGG